MTSAESQTTFQAHGRGVHRFPKNNGLGPGFVDALPTASAHFHGQLLGFDSDLWVCHEDGGGGYEWVAVGSVPPAGLSSPLTTKGDLWGFDTDDARVPVGSNGQILTADSTDAQGLVWADPPSVDTGYTVGPYVLYEGKLDSGAAGVGVEWTNMPAGSTELFGDVSKRRVLDLTDLTQYLFSTETSQAGHTTAVLDLQYTTDLTGAGGWTSMAGGTLNISAVATVKTAWVNIPAGAKAMVLTRVVGSGGNATADPRFAYIAAQFRGVGVVGPTGADGVVLPGTLALSVPIGDGVGALPVGTYVDVSLPFNGTWTKWRIQGTKYVSGSTGSAVIDLWQDSYANHPPTVADTITAAAKPTLSAAASAESSTLTGWTTSFSAGDILRVKIDSSSDVSLATLTLFYEPELLDRQAIAIPFGDSVSVPGTGIWRDVTMPVSGTWKKWRILGTKYSGLNTTGSVVFDLWRDTFANHPATVADTFVAAAKPTLTTGTRAESSTLTGWTTAFSAGDVVRVNIDSVSQIVLGTLILEYERTP